MQWQENTSMSHGPQEEECGQGSLKCPARDTFSHKENSNPSPQQLYCEVKISAPSGVGAGVGAGLGQTL